MKKDLIIGSNGMIGKAIYKCYGNNKDMVFRCDLDFDESVPMGNEKYIIRCMHICIPCKDKNKFIYTVLEYINKTQSEIVIIHSTVPVGTSREIYEQTKNLIVVHSPCCGKHPDLYGSIKSTFTKYFGIIPNNSKSFRKVLKIFVELFDKSSFAGKPENTEMAKILSTTEYAWHIAIATEFKRYCKENKVDFNFVYNEWRKNYSNGYKELGLEKFTRPVLIPCKDKILGHCVKENLVNLLKKYMKPTWLTDIKPKRLIE